MAENGTLTDLLVHKSGMGREQVEAHLDELTKHFLKTTDTGKDFKIEGFGTFKKENNITLFEPDEVLETEINQKYAGMKPIEVMGSFKETDTAIPVEKSAPAVAAEHPAQPEPEPKKTSAPAAEDVEEKSVPPPKETDKVEKTTADNEAGAAAIILIVIAVIIAILLAGWLLYSMNVFSANRSAANNPSAGNSVAFNEQKLGKNSNLEATKTAFSEMSIPVNATTESSNFNQIDKNIPLYGLKGTVQAEAKDGYTIVVHSLRRKNHALETLASIEEQGYRAIMLEAAVDGVKQWRLGIGQFKTVADAQKAAKKLPEPYRSNHFIKHQ